ncbi:MAG: hypothetical protein EOP34_11415 [Rickettsiales bacterium]|nr:MAG: hypothetical protein EOP34_11415 [Rickettsiales bacterium]
MSYSGDPTEVSNNKYAKISLPVDNNAAANNSSMQQPTNPVGDSSNTNLVGDSSNRNSAGDSSNTNLVGYYPSTDPRFALEQLALKKQDESQYSADQSQEWEYKLQDFLRDNPKPQPFEEEETQKR